MSNLEEFEGKFVTHMRLLAIMGSACAVLLVAAMALSGWTVTSARDAAANAVAETKAALSAQSAANDAKIAALKAQVEQTGKDEKDDIKALRAEFAAGVQRLYDKVDDLYKLQLSNQQRNTAPPGKGR